MTLQSSGAISLANVNVELGRSSTTNISLNESAVRTLAGVASGTISLSNLYGKSAITFTPASGGTVSNTGIISSSVTVSSSAAVTFTFTTSSSSGGTVSSSIASTSITIYLDSNTYWDDLNNNGILEVGETGYFAASANGTITATSGGSTIGSWNWSLSNEGQAP
jgi:hypothetical protein